VLPAGRETARETIELVTLSETLVTHLRYHRWATELVLEEVIALSSEQLMAGLKGSFSCIYDTIVHLYQSDRVWLDRLEERPSGQLADYEAPGCTWELRDAWLSVQDRMVAFADSLDQSNVTREIAYKNLAGQPFVSPVWQMILHIVNHGTHHRGQVTNMIRQLGLKPENLDLIRFYRTASAAQTAETVRA
jgi:uncharacterized damage-inducible protein DinB